MVMGPIQPIIRDMQGQPVLIGGQPVHRDPQGRVRAIGSQPIIRSSITGQSHLLGGGPVYHGMNTETSEEVGGLPIMRDMGGGISVVVGPRIGPPPLPPPDVKKALPVERTQLPKILFDLPAPPPTDVSPNPAPARPSSAHAGLNAPATSAQDNVPSAELPFFNSALNNLDLGTWRSRLEDGLTGVD